MWYRRFFPSILFAALAATPLAAQLPLPVRAAVHHTPALARSDGVSYLVYELHLTNYTPAQLNIISVAVLAAADTTRMLREYRDSSLMRNLRHLGAQPDSARPLALDVGRTAILYIWAPTRTSIPAALRHRVTVQLEGRGDTIASLTQVVHVDRTPPIAIGPPVRGSLWLAGIGPDPTAVPAHARLIYPTRGSVYMPQRFATDWVKVGADGKLFHGDSTRNENHYTYGEELIAVGDGVVHSVRTDVRDNSPPNITERMTTQTVAGNYIVIKLDVGGYAFYGHMAPGSTRLRPGERVKRGDVVGRIGNTGNSTGAHLHFHVTTEPVAGFVAAAEGIPFVFDRYEVVGRITPEQFEATDQGIPIGPFPPAGRIQLRDLPPGGSVVIFR